MSGDPLEAGRMRPAERFDPNPGFRSRVVLSREKILNQLLAIGDDKVAPVETTAAPFFAAQGFKTQILRHEDETYRQPDC